MSSGFSLVNSMSSGEFSGQTMYTSILAAQDKVLAIGDVVVLGGSSDADGVANIATGVSTGNALGVINSFAPRFAGEALDDAGGIPALTAGNAQVITDQSTLYRVAVTNGPLVAANVGLNANTVATEATKTGGLTTSNMTLNATGIATTITLTWKIVGLALDDQGDNLGSFAFVRLNASSLLNAVGV